MTLTAQPRPGTGVIRPARKGRVVVKWITTTDHKTIGTST